MKDDTGGRDRYRFPFNFLFSSGVPAIIENSPSIEEVEQGKIKIQTKGSVGGIYPMEGNMKKAILLATALLVLAALGFSQSRETGAITGKVVDDQGAALPGVSLTLTSANLMGSRTAISDTEGIFRFPALPPGIYVVKAELQGFVTVIQENIRLTTTVTLTLNLTMKPATVEEKVTVIAKSPTVDVKSTETASVTLSNEVLRDIPNSQFTSDIVNLAPGVTEDVAYGGSQDTGIAYSMDGVNVADPEGGSAWVFLDYNIIEEAKVMGIGLPAEYGNFTGVIFNLVTKSGGNKFSGHAELDFQGKKGDFPKGLWQTTNNQAFVDPETGLPLVTSPLSKLLDANIHLGGPIVRDKLWFYAGLQYYREQDYPTGFPEAQDYKEPRAFLKLTAQLTKNLNANASVEIDSYNGNNRDGSATVPPIATVTEKAPEVVLNFNLTQILSPKTFFDVKAAFFSGYYYLDPAAGPDAYMHTELSDNVQDYSSGYYFYADRSRFQANASLTHYVDNFLNGSHDFKFGVEVERSNIRDRYGYTGTGGPLGNNVKYFDYYGQPYLAYQYEGYDADTRYTRFEAFAQDSWQVLKRLNISVGVRLSHYWGQVKGISGSLYNVGRIVPRVGFTFDLFGDKKTILKGHFGQFSEAMLAYYLDRMNPASAYHDYIGYYWDGEAWDEFERVTHENLYHMDPNIKHPYMQQFTLGIERELFKDASLSVTYINREWKSLIGAVDLAADYDLIDYTVPFAYDTATQQWVAGSTVYQIYERTPDTVNTHDYLITNYTTASSPWVLVDPVQKYEGLEILFNKRFSNRWQLLASYVLSRATGTLDNQFASTMGRWSNPTDPNAWINANGHMTFDPTNMLKIQASYLIPHAEVNLNIYFRAITGDAWTSRYRTDFLNQGLVTFFLEPRGTNHYPMQKILDMRLEKIFTLAHKYRLGLIIDVFNLFNADTITSWGTRLGNDWNLGEYPSTAGHDLYGIVLPRQARVGIRVIF
jgi:outer membrane receptor protein involved in Fe transport